MKVKSIIVLTNTSGEDSVSFMLDATTTHPVMGYEASAKVNVAAGYGIQWVSNNFPGIPVEVIDCKPKK